MERLAVVVAAQGEHAWTARLLSVAASLREVCCIPVWPIEHTDYEPAMAAARTSLGEQAFAVAWAEGHNMTLNHQKRFAGCMSLHLQKCNAILSWYMTSETLLCPSVQE